MAEDAPKGTKLDFEVSGKLKGTSVVAAQKGTMVVVENLFNNLPVRRRELERNIKREWTRVVGVLGQYACIQTGIKFSVAQQTAKGKKTSLFSTKGNRSTRENIMNVFGAKTLTALVPMDLNLELEQRSGPGQRRSAQEDGGKKDVRIVGHISRPAFGEGRQTPDRQMFFVNTRPCGLPQVAKAFNEVYKSYNSSQSPFIFANIELDTRLYDVNVSPDKRTILLHDQAQMLENMKTALTTLFESQEHSVPVSQLVPQKQPSFKQLTLNRENTARVQTTHAQAESTDDEGSDEGSDTPSREGSAVEDRPRESSSAGLRRSTVSRGSLDRDSQASNLISKWVGRNSENRSNQTRQSAAAVSHVPESLSKDKIALIEKLKRSALQQQTVSDPSERSASIVPTDFTSQPLSPNRRPLGATEEVFESQSVKDDAQGNTQEIPEPPIPALRSPSKLSSAIANPMSSSRRSPRRPPELATITIGDHTVTSSIGTPCPKRPRLELSDPPGHAEVHSSLLSSFGSRLSQQFAAAGTPSLGHQEEAAESEISVDDESPGSVNNLSEESGINDNEESVAPISSQNIVEGGIDTILSEYNGEEDGEYIDEDEKKAQENAKVQEMINAAEEAAAQPSQENALRTKALLRGGSKKKDTTVNLVRVLNTNVSQISEQVRLLDDALSSSNQSTQTIVEDEGFDSNGAEEKLSLSVSKTDFAKMKIIGQFNLGFIIASRPSYAESNGTPSIRDELFIIDQHASDEKYNFERLQATTIVQSQRLVYPKTLDLTAMEEEIVIENLSALETNGFVVRVDETGDAPVGQRCQLVSLPLSRETAFSLTDLEELLALLAENAPGSVPRPSKVRKMFAMRACRSSIMIGRTLTHTQMGKVVKHLGELDKPWNCPHGRPTMRHLCGFGVWDASGWKEGDSQDGEKLDPTDWAAYMRRNKGNSSEATSP